MLVVGGRLLEEKNRKVATPTTSLSYGLPVQGEGNC